MTAPPEMMNLHDGGSLSLDHFTFTSFIYSNSYLLTYFAIYVRVMVAFPTNFTAMLPTPEYMPLLEIFHALY